MEENNYLKQLSKKLKDTCQIDKSLYAKYDVKHGLRNPDHTGVLAGLTNIGDVVGYRKEGDKIVPIEGELYYRGYSLEDIVNGHQQDKRHGFDEVSYLLLTGELPTPSELDTFSEELTKHRNIPESFNKNILSVPVSGSIMNMLARAVLGLYALDHNNPENFNEENIARQSLDLLAKFPTLTAYFFNTFRHEYLNKTLSIRHPKPELTTAQNFLWMTKGEDYMGLEADLLDLCLCLHAEHGAGNNSTFTVRVTSSAGTDTYAAISSGISSLKGIYHGGASLKVMNMMEYIKKYLKDWSNEQEIAECLLKILKKEIFDKSGKIYGIGHAVYTLSDPRSKLLKEKAESLAKQKGRLEEYNLYTTIERLAPQVFAEFKGGAKKILCANVDFYSGFVYDCIGISKELFVPIFAVSRLAGWCAHRLEEVNMSSKRIIRPAYKNVNTSKAYIPYAER